MASRTLNGATISYVDRGQPGRGQPGRGQPGRGQPGRGPALVLLHGFPLDGRMWNAQVEALSDAFRVIAPDFLGFGQSPPAGPFTIESLADDVHALAEALGALPCVLAGLSMGGYVALAYAQKYPATLRGLILLDTKAEGDTAEGKQGREKMIALAHSQGSAAVGEQMLPKLVGPDAMKSRPQVAREVREMAANNPPQTVAAALAAMRDRPDLSASLPSIAVPTLIIVGDADAITPPAVAQGMQRAIPRSQLVVVRGAGHMTPMEQPEQVTAAMRRFVDGL